MNWGAHKADVRIAAKNSVTMRAALRASINAQTIYEAYQETQPFVTDNNTQDRTRARAWAMLNVKIDPEPIKAALVKIYTDGFLLGLDASEEAFNKAEKEFNKAALTKANEYIDWANWKPGNRAAALLFRPTGAFKEILDNAGIVSKTIAKAGYDRIGTALSDSIAAGFSPGRAAKIIAEKIGDPARALTIAITEQNRAVSMATMQNYERFGLEKMEWSGAMPCDICAQNEGQVVAIGQPFNSGHTQPPVHPNCRCALLPPPFDDGFYAEPNASGVDDIMPAGEAAPVAQATMTVDEVLGYQREQGFDNGFVGKEQSEAITFYRGAGYDEINTYLRTGKVLGTDISGFIPKTSDLISKTIDAAPVLPGPIRTYRGVSGGYAETLGKYKPGTIYTDRGFTSTALTEDTAGYFAELRNNQQFLRIEIEIPAGTKGLDMTGFIRARDPKTGVINNKGEAEWLLPTGSKFEVLSNDGKTMKVRLIP